MLTLSPISTGFQKIWLFFNFRYRTYHQYSFKLDLEKLPTTSDTIRTHILRAYFQSYLWYHTPFERSVELDPVQYGYHLEDECFIPTILSDEERLPEDFPMPCKCIKCARKNLCLCRVKKIPCCTFCKCGNEDSC